MGKCSRNRGNRQQERDVKQGHGPQAEPWTNPLSQARPINDVVKNFRLSDVFTATPTGQGQGQGQAPDPSTAGPNTAYEAGYEKSRWNSLKAGLRARSSSRHPCRRSSTSAAATSPPSFNAVARGRGDAPSNGSLPRLLRPASSAVAARFLALPRDGAGQCQD